MSAGAGAPCDGGRGYRQLRARPRATLYPQSAVRVHVPVDNARLVLARFRSDYIATNNRINEHGDPDRNSIVSRLFVGTI